MTLPHTPDWKGRKQHKGSYAKILARLQRGPAKNYELTPYSLRYGHRIHVLRREGWDIETKKIKEGLFEYRLLN